MADHRDLCAGAGVAGDRFDLDQAVVNLRHFHGKQLRHEDRVGTGEENLRAAGFFAHIVDVGADPVADLGLLALDQLITAQHGLGPAEVEVDVAVLNTLDQAGDDLTLAVLEFLVLLLALGGANLLHDHLLGRLGGDPAQVDGRQFFGQEVADPEGFVEQVGVAQGDLRHVVFDFFTQLHDFAVAVQRDLTVLAVDVRADVVIHPVFLPAGALDGLFHRFEHLVALDAFFTRNHVGHLDQFQTRGRRCLNHVFHWCFLSFPGLARWWGR